MKHPGTAIVVAVAIAAGVRLLSVSHANLSTALTLLEHTEPAVLASGLLLSAAVLWLPVPSAAATSWLLSKFAAEYIERAIVGSIFLSVAGIAVVGGNADLDLSEIADGGVGFFGIAAFAGMGIGALHRLLAHDTAVRAERRLAAVADAPERPEPEPESDEVEDVDEEEEEEVEAEEKEEGASREGWLRVILGRADVVLGFSFAAVWTVLLLLLLLLVLWTVLSVPSQPAENLTIQRGDTQVTLTVHVVDDESDHWLVMSRRDRTIHTIKASDVRARYHCSNADLPLGMMAWTRRLADVATSEEAEFDPGQREAFRLTIDSEANGDGTWLRELADNPPPCELLLSPDEVDAVRQWLGIDCRLLDRCKETG